MAHRELNPALDETHYKADFALLDKYQAFSAEILRLAFAGFAAIAFFLDVGEKTVASPRMQRLLSDGHARTALIIAVLLFAGASAAALAHRGVSSDSMHYHLRLLRGSTEPGDRWMRDILLRCSDWAIVVATTFLALAVLSLGLVFIILLR